MYSSFVEGAGVPAENARHEVDVLAHAAALPLDKAIALLCDTMALEQRVADEPAGEKRFMSRVHEALRSALSDRDGQALTELHGALFALYGLHVADGTVRATANQFDPFLTRVRVQLEQGWLDHEARRQGPLMVPAGSGELVKMLKNLWAEHRAASHGLFDFLEKDASLEQMIAFFRSDSALNIRFFDLLLYSMIGSRQGVRKELVQNFWDESGRGEAARSHVSLFRRLLDVVGVGQAADEHASVLGWQGLAGHNLFMLGSLNRRHYFKLLGIMAMTELLDPSQYEKLARGCRRLGLGGAGELEYYDEHVTIDVVHGEGWLANVITPIVEETPEVAAQIAFGARLRLESCGDYYDALLARLMAIPAEQQAAEETRA